ncbi:DUF2142 domain-containing protein [Lachnospiraceae bacterium ZAX-1]
MDTMIQKIRVWVEKNKVFLGFALTATIIGLYIFNNYSALVAPFTNESIEKTFGTTEDRAYYLEEGMEYEQSFTINENTFLGVTLYLNGKGKNWKGTIKTELYDEDRKQCLVTEITDLQKMGVAKKKYYSLMLDQVQKSTMGKTYRIKIQILQLDEDTKVSFNRLIKGKDQDQEKDKLGSLFLNGEMQNTDLYFKAIISMGASLKVASYLSFFFYGAATIFIFWLLYKRKPMIHNAFVALSILIGLCYSGFITPMAAPDESAHYYSTYDVSNKMMGIKQGDKGYVTGRTDDMLLSGLSDETSRLTYSTAFYGFITPLKNAELVQVEQETVGVLDYFYYPAAVGFVLARLLGLGTLPLLYLGRFFNLLAFVLMARFAIKKAPFGKTMFTVIAISPMVMHQVSTLSYDALIFGLSYLYIAQALHLIYKEEKFSWKQWLPLLISGTLLATAKSGAYLPICFLVVLIPMKKLGGRKNDLPGERGLPNKTKNKSLGRYLRYAWGLPVVMALISFLNFRLKSADIVGGAARHMVSWPGKPTPTYVLSFLWEHPLSFIRLVLRTLSTQTGEYITSMFGVIMGSWNIRIPIFWVVCFIFVLFLAGIRIKGEKEWIPYEHKLWIAIICGGIFFLIEMAMLVGWTPITYPFVMGVQGRYFLPILPLIMLLLQNKAIMLDKDYTNRLLIAAYTINLSMVSIGFAFGVMR